MHGDLAIWHWSDPVFQIVGVSTPDETSNVTKPAASLGKMTGPAPRPREEYIAMYPDVEHPAVGPRVAVSWIDRDIHDFLAGRSEGKDLLHALYDHVLDEPVPERLRAVLKR